jgi:hypothetical protein
MEDAMAVGSMREFHEKLAVARGMEVRREEYLDHMTFRANAGPMFDEIFGPIVGLKEEWEAQGARSGELDLSAFRYRRAMRGMVPVKTGWIGGEEPRVIEETDEHVIGIDAMGRRMKLMKKVATLPLPMDWPVKGMDDWRRVKGHYEFDEGRFGEGWAEAARGHREAGRVVAVTIPGGFDQPRQLMGEEQLCEAFYDDPEPVHDMLETIGATAERVLERVSREVEVDLLFVHEDMAGRSGPLIGPKQVREFVAPYYRRVWGMLESRGARLFDQDSDGDMRPVLDAFIEAGVNMIHPVEPAAGMDMVELREKYGTKLAMAGGIDKHVLRRSEGEIVAELEYKIPPMVRTGGCVLGLDHRIPNGTPLANYRFYVRKAWEIMEREWRGMGGARLG